MGEIDFMDHLKPDYQLGPRSKYRFYLCLFLDSISIVSINAFVIYKKLENNNFPLKENKLLLKE